MRLSETLLRRQPGFAQDGVAGEEDAVQQSPDTNVQAAPCQRPARNIVTNEVAAPSASRRAATRRAG